MLVHAVFILKFIYISPDLPGKKRKHSSRMRTARLTMLGCPGSVSRGVCPGGVCPGGVWGCPGRCVSRSVCPERCPGGVQGMCVQGVCLGAVWGVFRGVCVQGGVRGCQGGVQGCESTGVCPGGVFRGVSRGGTPPDP